MAEFETQLVSGDGIYFVSAEEHLQGNVLSFIGTAVSKGRLPGTKTCLLIFESKNRSYGFHVEVWNVKFRFSMLGGN